MQQLMHSYNNAVNDIFADNSELKYEITLKIMDKLSQKFDKYSSIRSTFMISNEKTILNPTYSDRLNVERLLKGVITSYSIHYTKLYDIKALHQRGNYAYCCTKSINYYEC